MTTYEMSFCCGCRPRKYFLTLESHFYTLSKVEDYYTKVDHYQISIRDVGTHTQKERNREIKKCMHGNVFEMDNINTNLLSSTVT